MSTLVDPHICPDCRAPLDAAATCTGCGLQLVGPAAAELWERMQQADRLVEQLRATGPAPATRPASSAGVVATAPRTAPPTAPPPPPTAARPRVQLPSASVPVVLLALGGLCLLVAAVVFVVVAWGSLGLAARTTIMLGVTLLFGVAAVAVTRRTLRFAAETLWLVVSGLVALDLGAAYSADLLGLGRLQDRDAVGLVGAALLGVAIGAGAWVSSTELRRWHGAAAVAGVGTVLLAGAEAWTSENNPVAVAVSVPVLALAALGIDRVSDRHLRPVATVVGAASLVSWLVLLGYGVDRMSTTTASGWWTDASGWPLLVAAALAAVPAVWPSPTGRSSIPEWARPVAAGGSLLSLALFGAGPSSAPTAELLGWAAVSVLLAAVSAAAPRTWAWPAACLSAIALVVWSAWSLLRPLDVISRVPASAPVDENRLGLHVPQSVGGPAAWTAVVAVLVVGATAAGLLRHLPTAATREAAGRALIALGPGVLALGAVTALLETGPTLLAAVASWSVVILVTGVMAATVRRHDAALTASLLFLGYAVVAGLRLASASHLLAACLATLVAVLLAAAYARAERDLLRQLLLPLLAGGTVVLAGFAAVNWPYLFGGRDGAAALCLAAVGAAAILLAAPAARDLPSRWAMEGTGLLAGLFATAVPTSPTAVAAVLTVLGSAVALVSVLRRDRDLAAWLAVVLLGLATVVRVADDVRAPEVYTLPAALLLLAAGWWRLSADQEATSARALSSGLTLALAPSLLLALDDPTSLRGVLVAVGGLVVLAVGVARLWAAPFVAGAATTAVLAVRHLGPLVDGLPRWISLGSVGVLLLVVGVTWEQRRRDVAAAGRYLASMR